VGKNVAVFVDVANIFYAAKAAGVDIDYVTLLKSAGAGRDLVRAYAYTGLDPDNENQRNFHDFLRRHGYKVVSKDIRKYGDGKVKANLDIELVVDMMKTARNLDIAIVVSGDGDFAPAIRAVQEMGVRVEVISFRGNTSSDLIEVADLFTDITQLARVEKGSRSGRRVAGDDADLSMTEVPDKQTEGTGAGRGRGRTTRGRGRATDSEPAATGSRGRGRSRPSTETAGVNGNGSGLVALPGERLSRRAGAYDEADLAAAEVFTLDAVDADAEGGPEPGDVEAGEGGGDGRRRRRRGGRGRGRGRGREEGAAAPVDATSASQTFEDLDEEDEPVEAPRPPRSTPFGSVWDSQIGTPTVPRTTGLTPLAADDEDFDEPEIPEYLIAEQRRDARGRGPGQGQRGPRGGRSAYQSAIARERFGTGSRSGGINRYPDVSGRTAERDRGPRDDRGRGRPDDRGRGVAPRSSSAEPWSEVPPELEAMLRAQVGSKPSIRGPEAAPTSSGDTLEAIAGSPPEDATTPAAAPKRRATRKSPAVTADSTAAQTADDPGNATAPAAAPKRRTTRKTAATTEDAAPARSEGADGVTSTATPKRRTTRRPAAATSGEGADPALPEAAPAPKRRTIRRTTSKADPA
jgi:uncharacterized LabA/DUF88 family protein